MPLYRCGRIPRRAFYVYRQFQQHHRRLTAELARFDQTANLVYGAFLMRRAYRRLTLVHRVYRGQPSRFLLGNERGVMFAYTLLPVVG